ncbi:hypothetical protein KIN20_031152 [Parelaphostrongylus tenuis]|uniref:Uncharacterized protein n=1 Tax=Parelaphostrongylus tenuis TaxID=148309 RepID=A0AAD5WGN2_PARTN|nr:hypothetical protein KIN20_031152 [Parelaphostrongylus tenuis]
MEKNHICFKPSINIICLVVFIVIGVLLVTITIDFVVAEVINHVHYMGRHVGKARMIADGTIAEREPRNYRHRNC